MDTLVGRAGERAAITTALRELPAKPGLTVVLEGEPGIGKSRLLAFLAEEAASGGATVLGARASEFERDVPYALWTEALERHLSELGEHRISRLGLEDPRELGAVLPGLAGAESPRGSRHGTHRALRDLLGRLAARSPLVVWMDDVQWADPASIDALGALVRRPPEAPLLFAVAAREGQLPAALALAVSGAHAEHRVATLRPAPLSEAEAVELVGQTAPAIYRLAGGNPFYLEQLARVRAQAPRPAALDGSVPAAVAAALFAELDALAPDARRVLDAAAVAGDPFEPGLAAAVAELPEPVSLEALDDLVSRALVRPSATPRRFTFRHPLVRHAVYVATPPAWRLGAHARAAQALELRGAGVVERAHHVELSARPGDEDAITLLETAAAALQSQAPGRAARFHAAALRLLPDRPAEAGRRRRIQRRLADAHAAAGDPAAARDTLLGALDGAEAGERLSLTVGLANQEQWLEGHEAARRRLQVALVDLPAQPSADRIRLRLALALTSLLACDLDAAGAHAGDAESDARAIGDPVFELAGLACGALASASAADPGAGRRLEASTAALERLTPAQVATRLPAFWMHGRARRAVGQFAAALAELRRGAEAATETGRERVVLMTTVESVAVLIGLGRLSEASDVAEDGVERARLAANPRILLWAQSARSSACLAAGDVSAALRHAEDAAEPGTRSDFHAAGQPGWCLGAALTAAGNPGRAACVLLEAFGGCALPRVLPADRPAAAADLIDAQLALEDVAAAEETLVHAQEQATGAGAAPGIAATGIARTAVELARGRPGEAVETAAAARAAAREVPLLSARALLAEGRAHAAAGDRHAAVEALTEAGGAFERFRALRLRDEATRELRRLGRRVVRPARAGAGNPLTAREQEVAELVAAGRTSREIAEQLVLSTRTIEAHLRTIYRKLAVRSRVELAHAIRGGHPGI